MNEMPEMPLRYHRLIVVQMQQRRMTRSGRV